MIGVVLTGHGKFAPGMTDSLRLIAGEQECFTTVEFTPELAPEALSAMLRAAAQEVMGPEGVMILCDLPGGTPFNEAVKLVPSLECPTEVLAGVSLPAIIEACTSRDEETLPALAELVLETGLGSMVRFVLEEASDEDFDE